MYVPFSGHLPCAQIKARVGGQVKIMTTGASPISDEVMMFLRVCFGAKVVEGYGMTETSCTISLTRYGRISPLSNPNHNPTDCMNMLILRSSGSIRKALTCGSPPCCPGWMTTPQAMWAPLSPVARSSSWIFLKWGTSPPTSHSQGGYEAHTFPRWVGGL